MRILPTIGLLLAACSAPARKEAPPAAKKPPEDEAGLAIARRTERIEDRRKVPRPTKAEVRDFRRIWEFYRKGDPRWPLERDRFKVRSDAAGYLLAGNLLRYYMRVNAVRTRAARELASVKSEIEAVGEPCVPTLVTMLVLDRIKLARGRYFYTDDITRQDCLEMLEGIGSAAVPELLETLRRPDLGVKGRRLTALALGGTGDPRALAPLVRLLESDPSWEVRADAASALGALGDPKALEPLGKAVRGDPDPAVVKRAGKERYRIKEKLRESH